MYLYFGDDDIRGAAAYLSGVLLGEKIPFERVDSSREAPDDFVSKKYSAYILSDYPEANFKPGHLAQMRDAVAGGCGLLMLGGWESYYGCRGEYHDTVLAEVLPVQMLREDDRRNFAQSAIVYKEQDHPMLDGLPWHRPPCIGGCNQFVAKPDARTILSAIRSDIRIVRDNEIDDCGDGTPDRTARDAADERLTVPFPNGEAVQITLTETFPLLVVGQYGRGRTAALATDVAPHWIGGWVDWGGRRFSQKIPDGNSIEVGADYARFFAQLIRWVGGEY